jgi:UPF0176 protein
MALAMNQPMTISTFYSFSALPSPESLRLPILEAMQRLDIRGTITLAREGINATISGTAESMDALMRFLNERIDFTTPTYRESYFAAQPFKRSKVKVKRELISLGVETFPAKCVGSYVMPEDWNALISNPNVVIIDTRNDYEFALGSFEGAINPATSNFKEMVRFTDEHLDLESGKTIAMYCTGGIRCDKYSSYLLDRGFPHIYHLHGGILAYLERIPPEQSLWRGTCFVFDDRVSVGHGLLPGC